MSNLLEFANEINKDWTSEYRADVINNRLIIFLNGEECASMSEKGDIDGDDEDAVDQLVYMAGR